MNEKQTHEEKMKNLNSGNQELKALLAELFAKEQTPESRAENREFLSSALTDIRITFMSLGGKISKPTTNMRMFGAFMMLADTYSIEKPTEYFQDFLKYIHGNTSKDDFINVLSEKELHLKEFF